MVLWHNFFCFLCNFPSWNLLSASFYIHFVLRQFLCHSIFPTSFITLSIHLIFVLHQSMSFKLYFILSCKHNGGHCFHISTAFLLLLCIWSVLTIWIENQASGSPLCHFISWDIILIIIGSRVVVPKVLQGRREPPKSFWSGGLQQQHNPQDPAAAGDGWVFLILTNLHFWSPRESLESGEPSAGLPIPPNVLKKEKQALLIFIKKPDI